MAAVAEMTPAEKRSHGHSKNKERFVKATRFIRELTIDRAYTLREELDSCLVQEERDALLQDWSSESGRDTGALRDDLQWTNAIREHDLRGVFTSERIEPHEWQSRIGISHLRRIGKAFNVETGEIPTSEERASLVLECFHGNWTVKELELELVNRKLRKPPKKRMKHAPTKNLTACTLMFLMAETLQKQGIDIDLGISRDCAKPMPVSRVLQRLAERFAKEHPMAEFRLTEETTCG